MELPILPDPRLYGAAVAIIGFVLVSVIALFMRRFTVSHRSALRMFMVGAWLYGLTRVYSATSYLWAGEIDRAVLSVLRYVIVAVTTASVILWVAVLIYYLRLLRR